MPKVIDQIVIGEILGYIRVNTSFSVIKKVFEKRGISLSNGLISKIKKTNGNYLKTTRKKAKLGCCSKMSASQLKSLKKDLVKENPRSIRELGRKYDISHVSIVNWRKKFQLKKLRNVKFMP